MNSAKQAKLTKRRHFFSQGQFKEIEGAGYIQSIYPTLIKSEKKGQVGVECANGENVSSLKSVCL